MIWRASAFFETREASVCGESLARFKKLSECRGQDIDDHLKACHLGQLRGKVQEYELIVNRSGLPHDLSPDQSVNQMAGGLLISV